jgi:D-threo-aldose 1-dehydrogenase
VGIINSAVFHGGFLTGGDTFDYRDVDPDSEQGLRLYAWRAAFYQLCREHHVEPGDACLQFAASHPAIVSLALNTSKPDTMRRNVEVLQKRIPGAFWKAMKEAELIDREYNYL